MMYCVPSTRHVYDVCVAYVTGTFQCWSYTSSPTPPTSFMQNLMEILDMVAVVICFCSVGFNEIWQAILSKRSRCVHVATSQYKNDRFNWNKAWDINK